MAAFGNRPIKGIVAGEIESWLHALALSPQSINNYRAIVRALFEYALKRELVEKNPVTSVDKVKLVDKAPEIFTPKELADMKEGYSDILWQHLVSLCCVPPALRFVQRYLHRKWLLKPPYIGHNMHKFS